MTCRLCAAMRAQLPGRTRAYLEGIEASRQKARQAKRERAQRSPFPNTPPGDVQ